MKDRDSRVLVALGEADERIPGARPTVILGVSAGAWDYMRGGLTHDFDLSGIGIPINLLMFRGKDYADLIATIENAARETRMPIGGLRDLGIRKGPTQ